MRFALGLLAISLATQASSLSYLTERQLAIAVVSVNPLGKAITLESQGSVGEYNSVAVRANGLPIISFNPSLNVYDCANPTCSSGTMRELDTGVIWYNDITIRADGRPFISYAAPFNELRAFDCADSACTSGTVRPLESSNVSYPSVAVRLDGRPIISYLDSDSAAGPTAVDVKVYDCADANCSSGEVRIVSTFPSNVRSQTDIAIRADGRPIISYFHDGPDDMAVYDCNNDDCTSGTVRFVDTDGSVGHDNSIAIGANGFPIMSYWDSSWALRAFACGDADCTSGDAPELDREAGAIVGQETSIVVPPDGLPIISYHDQSNGTLKVYDCADAACSMGEARLLDAESGVGVGDNTTITVGADDHPIISYWDRLNNDLKLFICGDPRCQFNEIELLLFSDGFEGP